MPIRFSRALAAGLAAGSLLTACGGSDAGTAPPATTTGAMSVAISGLPSDIAGSVAVTGPSGYTNTVTAAQTLSALAPGSYLLTPAGVFDRSIGYAAPTATVTVTAGATATGTAAYTVKILARSTTNRADVSTLPRFKILYVVPSDGTDRGLDTAGLIHRAIGSGQRWLAAQTAGRSIRLDLAGGLLDITFVRAPRTDAAYYSYNAQILDSLQKDLNAAGWSQANVMNFVFYDGRHIDSCGSAVWPPNFPGNTGAIYLKGAPTSAVPCATTPFAATPTTAPAYQEFIVVHEMFHMLGVVSTTAPNHALSGHVGNDPTDLMYAGSLVWRPSVVDITKTNYYNAAGLPAGQTNFATSPFVITP